MFKETQKARHLVMFFVLLIGILVGGYLVLTSKISLSEITKQVKQQISPNENTNTNTDNDHDGLTNKEEKNYGTDANKRDTDNDGYLDGEEIVAGRDPLKPAPNDESAKSAIDPKLISENLTKIVSLKTSKAIQDGNILLSAGDSDNSYQFDLNNLDFQSDINHIFSLPEISGSQIKIISDNSEEAIKNYFLTAIKTISKNFPPEQFSQPAAELISAAFQTQNYSGFQKYTRAYENNFNEIKNLSVPSTLAEKHKNTLNILWILKNTFEALEQTSQDPTRALVALENLDSVAKLLNNLSSK